MIKLEVMLKIYYTEKHRQVKTAIKNKPREKLKTSYDGNLFFLLQVSS